MKEAVQAEQRQQPTAQSPRKGALSHKLWIVSSLMREMAEDTQKRTSLKRGKSHPRISPTSSSLKHSKGLLTEGSQVCHRENLLWKDSEMDLLRSHVQGADSCFWEVRMPLLARAIPGSGAAPQQPACSTVHLKPEQNTLPQQGGEACELTKRP